MPLGASYATVAQLEARTGQPDNGTYTQLLAAASRHVESFTGRQFNQVAEATARKFRALDCERLPLDDFHTLTDFVVSTNGLAWDPTNFEADPPDGVKDGVPGWPFEALFAVNRSWPLQHFRRKTITVTARWGWSAVPAGIVEATLDVAFAMFIGASIGSGNGIISSETVGPFSVSFAVPPLGGMDGSVPQVLLKAVPFKRLRFGVG